MPQPAQQPVKFEITDQTHDYVYNQDGTQTGRWTIHFRTPSGVLSQIRIGENQYNPLNVGQAIAHQVRTIEAVHNMTESHPPSGPQ